MNFLLELKDNIGKVYNKYNPIIVPASKFLVTLVALLLLNANIGYMSALRNPLIILACALLCAFLPASFIIIVFTLMMVGNLYAISAEMSIIAACVIILMYLLYFRFSPKKSYVIMISLVACLLKIPAAVPIALGLACGLSAIIPVAFGVILYYIIKLASDYETAITNSSFADSMQQISYVIESFLNNKACIATIVILAITILIVYIIKRLSIDNAIPYSIAVGTVIEFVMFIMANVIMDIDINLFSSIIGIILGLAIGVIYMLLFANLDYRRTEHVQYEDDEYYYYVKAVPKVTLTNKDVRVKQINGRKARSFDENEE